MNSFFKKLHFYNLKNLLLFLIFFLLFNNAFAITINALYLGACKREVGIILDVDQFQIKFLTLRNKLIEIPRYEIIYISYYPLSHLPLKGKVNLNLSPLKIKTLVNNKVMDLLTGWVHDFTKDRLSFITIDGKESVIDRNSIWNLEKEENIKNIFSSANWQHRYKFIHPHAFQKCPIKLWPTNKYNKDDNNKTSNKKIMTIYPQQILSDPIVIKKEIDRLMEGYLQIDDYIKEKRFYAVPQVYKEKTSLGIWQNFGSRYGSSKNRTNNLLPFLEDERSKGPFDYQQIIKTGSGPMSFGFHEESQNHFLYAFKASYFHFTFMADPNVLLVGKNYAWKKEDFESSGDRLNDLYLLEMGFDFGRLSFLLFLSHTASVGVKYEDSFEEFNIEIPNLGISYRNHLFKIESLFSFNNSNEIKNDINYELDFFRFNLFLYFIKKMDLQYSLIMRDSNINQEYNFSYSGKSLTNYLSLKYKLTKRYYLGGYFAIENYKNSFSQNVFYKLGTYVALSF